MDVNGTSMHGNGSGPSVPVAGPKTSSSVTRGEALRQYLAVARRRGIVVVVCVILLPLAAYLYSQHQERTYQGSAEVLLNNQNLANALTGTPDNSGFSNDPERIPDTQARIAQSHAVLLRASAAVPQARVSPLSLGDSSSVAANTGTDTLTFQVTNASPRLAQQLTNAYAKAFISYRRFLDTEPITTAMAEVHARLRGISPRSALYASLITRLQQLQTLDALQTSNAELISPATAAKQVSPRPTRDAAIGLILGLILGVALAALFEALDTRIPTLDEIERIAGVPLLAALPAPSRRRAGGRERPLVPVGSPQSEPYQLLRVALSFAFRKPGTKVLMVTSALGREGKTTTTANLARAFAAAGKTVAVVDLDLRHPTLAETFGLPLNPGVTEIMLGEATLQNAVVPVDFGGDDGEQKANTPESGGSMQVLPSGVPPPVPVDVGTFESLPRILADLRSRVDIVLLDTPPALLVSDALTLSSYVDGVLLIARAKTITRRALREVVRLLTASPAPLVGLAATGADASHQYGGGYGYAYGSTPGAEAPPKVHVDRRKSARESPV